MRRAAALRLAALAAAVLPAAGCQSVSELLGAATGTAAAAGTANPAVGIAVGVGTRAVADWGLRTVARRWHRAEQEAVAAAVGAAAPGDTTTWVVRRGLPFGHARGKARVLRLIDTPFARCKEAAFSLEAGADAAESPRRWFVTTVCQQGEGWRWAAAEPAVGRWGSLH